MRYKNLLTVMLFLVPLLGQASSFNIGTFPADLASPGLNLVVDSTLDLGDANPGDGICATASATCTLRAAVEETNAYEGHDSITLPAGTYVIASTLEVFDGLTLLGADRDTTVIDSDGAGTALYIDSSLFYNDENVSIDSITVQGAGTGIDLGYGGLSLISSRVRDNSTYGVRCEEDTQLSILDSEVVENRRGVGVFLCEAWIVGSSISQNRGTGVFVYEEAHAIIEDCYVGENLGAGISADGPNLVKLRSTTVANNGGGGFSSDGCAGIDAVNSTFSGNGISIPNNYCGPSWLSSSTITGGVGAPQDTLFVTSTILAGYCGPLVSGGYNLIGDTTGCSIVGDTSTNITDVDPKLGPLADNGGPTPTHRPLIGSPAIDVIPCSGGVDQRGVARPQGPGCDIGSVEGGLSCIGFGPPLNKKQVLLRGPYRRLPVKARIVDAKGVIQTGADLSTAPVVRIVKLPASDPGYELGSFRIKNNGVWRATVSAQDFPEKGKYLLFMDTGESSEYLFDETCSVIVKRR